MLKEFYTKAMPDEGVYCVAYNIPNTDAYIEEYADSLDEAVELINTNKKMNRNTFMTMSTLKEKKRIAANTLYIKSLYIDIDVGETKDYATQKEALLNLSKFLEATKLPLPSVVNSGNGIHAYWFLKQQLSRAEWKPIADQLKELCVQHDLKIDRAITGDSVRLLRCPDTNNFKKTPPRPTLVLRDAPSYDLKTITKILDKNTVPLEVIVKQKTFTDEEKKRKYGNLENRFKPLLIDSVRGNEKGCGQIKHYVENLKTAPEPLWWRVLSLANNCADRDEMIHLISKGHPNYTFEETEKKASGAVKTCKDFNEVNPGICTLCPHWQKISTPIQMHSYPIKKEVVEEIPALEGEHLPKVQKDPSGLSASMDAKGYWIGANHGGVYKSVTLVDKKGVSFRDDKLVYEYPIVATRHVKSSASGNCILVNVWYPHDGFIEFILPMKVVYDKIELRKVLTSSGIYYESSDQEDLIMKYFMDWARDMQKKSSYDIMYDQMGWNESKDSFVIGSTEITRDGQEKSTPISPLASSVAPFLSTSGTYEGWRTAAQKLGQQGLEMHMFTMMCGFGSILMDFSSTTGVAISLTGESGAAKTGALYGALSIWGQPKSLSVMNTTANALQGRFLTLHNLPMGFDEVGNKNPYLLSDFILAVSQGKAKLKMQASTNTEREYEAPASLIAILTSNHSIYDKLKTIRSNPNGEAARLIEFTVRKPKAFYDDARIGKEIFDEFNTHYGWAGSDFVKAVFNFGSADKVKQNLGKWENRFVQDFGNDTAYRFYENLVAVTMTAGEIVNGAGILQIDIERVYKFIVGEMISIRDDVVKVNQVDYEAILQDYLDANMDKVLAFKDEKIISEPYRQLTVRIDNDKDVMFISKKELDTYLSELTISTKEFVFQLKSAGVGIEAGKEIKQRMNAGWKDVSKSATAVYKIKLSTLGRVDAKVLNHAAA